MKNFFKRKHLFNFPNYSKDSKLFDLTNNKKSYRKMKDEFEGKIVDEFFGSNSKMYSITLLTVKNLIQQKE